MCMSLRSILAITALAVTLGGCTQLPALDGTITPEMEAADFPEFEPMPALLSRAKASRTNPGAEQAQLNARVAALRARAARLRKSVLSGPERVRLREGLR